MHVRLSLSPWRQSLRPNVDQTSLSVCVCVCVCAFDFGLAIMKTEASEMRTFVSTMRYLGKSVYMCICVSVCVRVCTVCACVCVCMCVRWFFR